MGDGAGGEVLNLGNLMGPHLLAWEERAASLAGPIDAVVRGMCERQGYHDVLDAAARCWWTKHPDAVMVPLWQAGIMRQFIRSDRWAGPATWERACADQLADEVEIALHRKVITQHHPAARALTQYRGVGKRSPRADDLAARESRAEEEGRIRGLREARMIVAQAGLQIAADKIGEKLKAEEDIAAMLGALGG